jgi:putative nucleotidyltransferase with HDIG domain
MKLTQLIPEFDLIEDADLRAKCIRTWELAIERGGWSVDDLARIPFTLLIPDCPATFIEHVRAVTLAVLGVYEAVAKTHGDKLPLNRDYLIAGGLLHDVGKLLEIEREGADVSECEGVKVRRSASGKLMRHPFSGTVLAAECGLPDEVLHLIATHSHEGDHGSRTPESTILHHCDFAIFDPLRDLYSR